MENLFRAADIITSDLLYGQVMALLSKFFTISEALLLASSSANNGLNVVDVKGKLPPALTLPDARPELVIQPAGLHPLITDHEILHDYQAVFSFPSDSGELIAFLVFTSDEPIDFTDDHQALAAKIGHLFQIKQSFASLPVFEKIQSKLKYQMSFFANTINNIFEPYDYTMLLQLYIEIISEMFLLPAAVTLELSNNKYVPTYAKGAAISDFADFYLDGDAFEKNRSLRMFPTIMAEVNPQVMGDRNMEALNRLHARLMVPLSLSNGASYMIVCMNEAPMQFDYQDKLSLLALCNTLNRALELSDIRISLMNANRDLDRKVFALSTLYQAAEKIFAKAGIEDTLGMALDMLMEIFQSAISSVFIYNKLNHKYELVKVKSALQTEAFSFWFEPPTDVTAQPGTLIEYRTSQSARSEFLTMFPQFESLDDRLNPLLIAHLFYQNEYFGFITLSDRVPGIPYAPEDKELLLLLTDSIALALNSAHLLNELEYKNRMLDRQIQDMMAIQDVVQVIRKARDLDDLCGLISIALDISIGAISTVILSRDEDDLAVLSGQLTLMPAVSEALLPLESIKQVEIRDNAESAVYLAAPLIQHGLTHGYILLPGFKDTVLEDSGRIRLLELTASVLSDTFAAMKEQKAASVNRITDYSRLIWYRINREIQMLSSLGLVPEIVKFFDPDPAAVIAALAHGGSGFVLAPGIGVFISYLDHNETVSRFSEHTTRFAVLDERTMHALYALEV